MKVVGVGECDRGLLGKGSEGAILYFVEFYFELFDLVGGKRSSAVHDQPRI